MPKTDIQALIVRRLNEVKDRGGLSKLSRRSNISYRYILAVTHGEIADPSFRRLSHLAGFLGIRITYEPY